MIPDAHFTIHKVTKLSKRHRKWSDPFHFQMYCISTSMGLASFWRFPYIVYENGGGTFMVPYLIVLFLVGQPMLYLEIVLGQFTGLSGVNIWKISPVLVGTSALQVIGMFYVISYYMFIVSLNIYYLVASSKATLPWSLCQSDWPDCIPSVEESTITGYRNYSESSAELFFKNIFYFQENVEFGIGYILWYFIFYLISTWFLLFLIAHQGAMSPGKFACMISLLPYGVLCILFLRAISLEGAWQGIKYFIIPEWGEVFQMKVWHAAISQVFMSLLIGTGIIYLLSSFNEFKQDIYKTAGIMTIMDMCVSLVSGLTVYSILGNLAHELGHPNITTVFGASPMSLAFVVYPEAIAKMPFMTQFLAICFFLLMIMIGLSAGVVMFIASAVVVHKALPRVRILYLVSSYCTFGFLAGLIYTTSGGPFIVQLVDYFGGSFARLCSVIMEIIGVIWMYGLENICLDIEYMLLRRTGFFIRVSWAIITPIITIMSIIFAVFYEKYEIGLQGPYPNWAYNFGAVLQWILILPIPICAVVVLKRNNFRAFKNCPRTSDTFGPSSTYISKGWRKFLIDAKANENNKTTDKKTHLLYSIFGKYRKDIPLPKRGQYSFDAIHGSVTQNLEKVSILHNKETGNRLTDAPVTITEPEPQSEQQEDPESITEPTGPEREYSETDDSDKKANIDRADSLEKTEF